MCGSLPRAPAVPSRNRSRHQSWNQTCLFHSQSLRRIDECRPSRGQVAGQEGDGDEKNRCRCQGEQIVGGHAVQKSSDEPREANCSEQPNAKPNSKGARRTCAKPWLVLSDSGDSVTASRYHRSRRAEQARLKRERGELAGKAAPSQFLLIGAHHLECKGAL
jgi:hypothetical protein